MGGATPIPSSQYSRSIYEYAEKRSGSQKPQRIQNRLILCGLIINKSGEICAGNKFACQTIGGQIALCPILMLNNLTENVTPIINRFLAHPTGPKNAPELLELHIFIAKLRESGNIRQNRMEQTRPNHSL